MKYKEYRREKVAFTVSFVQRVRVPMAPYFRSRKRGYETVTYGPTDATVSLEYYRWRANCQKSGGGFMLYRQTASKLLRNDIKYQIAYRSINWHRRLHLGGGAGGNGLTPLRARAL
ncbi:hypothetical protein EVAR_10712_1 [Eumeta japonica]|uniref:Uncharacterized protein n=1 Tax=Eumeta variegata TaxID=151549 RepID=A0A4C1U750_EUMVA|nr:hypothetical protein EVAR_10712_1 [Eumeta japonica]